MIRVKGITYKVVHFEPSGDEGVLAVRPEVPMGLIDQLSATIYIRRDADPNVQRETLIHEATHGLTLYEDFDENVVSRVSADLYNFLVSNDLLREDWWDKIIDEYDESVGEKIANDIDPVRAMDRAEAQSIP